MRFLRCAGAIGLVVFGTAPLAPQQAGEQSTGPVIRVTVDLVQLDAVVTDSTGHHVANLKSEDFRILEDGKPQAISHFSYVPGTVIPGGQRRGTQSSETPWEGRLRRFPHPAERFGRKRFSAR
jgi:hypothetical protein